MVTRNTGIDLWITKNIVRNSGESGLLMLDDSNCVVRSNTLDGNQQFGILCQGPQQATITSNEITGSKHAGVGVLRTACPMLRNNDIHDNANGIHVSERGAGTIVNNNIHNISPGVGITVSAGGDPIVSKNYLTDCKSGAIVAYNRAAGQIFQNWFKLMETPPAESWYHYGLGRVPNWVVVCDALPTKVNPLDAEAQKRYSTTEVRYNRGMAPIVLSAAQAHDLYDYSSDEEDGAAMSDEEHTPRANRPGYIVKKYLPRAGAR